MQKGYIHIINVQGTDICQLLDSASALLALSISKIQVELLHSGLDSVPSGQPAGKVDISSKTEICRVDDLVCGWVGQDGFGVDTSLVGESAEASDVVVEGDVDLNSLSNKVLEVAELMKLVLGEYVVPVGDDHTSHEATKRGNSITLTNTEDRGIDVGSTSLKSTVGVGDGTSSVVVEVCLNVARNDTSEGSDEIIHLPWRSASDGISNTHSVNTDLVDSPVNAQKVDQIGSEGIFRGESDLNPVGLDILNNLHSGFGNVIHVLAVRVLTEERRGANDDVNAINTSLNSYPGIIHVASDVCQDLGQFVSNKYPRTYGKIEGLTLAFKPSLQMASQSALDCSEATGLVNSICKARVSMSHGISNRGKAIAYIVNTELIQSLSNLNLLSSVEESIGELLSLS